MNPFLDLINNTIFLVPLFAWLLCQVLKVIIHALVEREFRIERLFGDGGMPSGHSATVVSLATMVGWCCGFDTALFVVAAVFAIVVMKDATGVRRETGKQADIIKELANGFNALFIEKDDKIRTEKLKSFVGHTPLQVFFGSLIGLLVAIIYILIFSVPYSSILI